MITYARELLMRLGLFLNPGHNPAKPTVDAVAWDLELVRWAEELGYNEVWIGEHLTVPWESCPAPDLFIAQALRETTRIRIGPASLNLPLHHPALVAHRIAYLDRLSGGRLNLGIGASGTATDWRLFGIDGAAGDHRKMMWESLDAVVRLWTDPEPYVWQGEFWAVNKPEPMFDGLMGFHMAPLQGPHPPISVSGLTPESPTLRECGARGLAPLTLAFSLDYLAGQWASVAAGAASAGRIANRDDWGIAWDVFVAETDDEAIRACLEGGLGDYLDKFWLPLVKQVGLVTMYKNDPAMSDAEVTAEYFLRHCAMVGSVDTVVDKLAAAVDATGGFGTLIHIGHDHAADPGPMRASMELLAREVMPRVSKSADR
jgi:alkanesulfonate monooxygenase SsuD/methylene tetrahydromethanopterin reductase-like flavin-dependent oxidoreductase (luciferase family)